MDIEKVKVTDLILDPSNVRKHDNKNLMAIKGSLAKFGLQKPIVVNKKNIVLAGNGTLEAAIALGLEYIDIVRSELEGPEATAYSIADNRTSDLSVFDDDALKQTLSSLADMDFDLSSIGFDNAFLDKKNDDKDIDEPEQKYEILIKLRNEKEQQNIYNECINRGLDCIIL